MQFPKTRRKIEEAEYFLGQMEEGAHKALLHGGAEEHDMKVFRFNLSAFLSAGMSVRKDVLRKESKKVFLAVHPTWEARLPPEDRPVWDAMKTRRGDEVHMAHLELARDTVLIPITEARGYAHWPPSASQVAAITATVAGFADGGEWPKVGVLAPQFVNDDGSRADVFDECRRYLTLLKQLLEACERFTPGR
jgi:hypothetical protein